MAELTYPLRMGHVGIVKGTASRSSARVVRFRLHGSSLGVAAANSGELIRQVERGFSFQALRALQSRSGIAIPRIASIIGIPERTLARRRVSGRLSPEESERLLRISRVFEDAVDLFEGDVAAAVNWLNTPRKALDSQTPLAFSRTELGAREVENLIGRLEHGVFS
jgi:putative toxin-antitoxin system antitoxin component (TIGR02293 family)